MASFLVNNLGDSGVGTLRQALLDANNNSGVDDIQFSVTGSVILASDLPAITDAVTINGASAPGFDGAPLVEIDFNGYGGLVFSQGADSVSPNGSQLLFLSLVNGGGHGVTVGESLSEITIQGNFIGVSLDGAVKGNQGDGIYLSNKSFNNLIGAETSASGQFQLSNLISGNQGNGIQLFGSSGNRIAMNYIGSDRTGSLDFGNGQHGIYLTAFSGNNLIGGAETGGNNPVDAGPFGDGQPVVFVTPPQGNLISGNDQSGVYIDGSSQFNTLQGNFIGTVADGNAPLGNGEDGVTIDEADFNALIGTTFSQNPFVFYNVISGNAKNGLRIRNANSILINANFFGIGANNATLVGNGENGVLVEGDSNGVTLGGVIPLGNVISGNALNGVEVKDQAANFVSFNTFGGLFAFGGAAPNGRDGILVTATGGNNQLRTNVFSGNIGNGIHLGGNASGVTVYPNVVGATTFGDAPLPNGGHGLLINDSAHNNFVGGFESETPSVIPINLFSGNEGYGIVIADLAHDNTIIRSQVGGQFAPQGSTSDPVQLANQLGGILITGAAYNTVIGGTENEGQNPAVRIQYNGGNGVSLETTGSGNQLIGNAATNNQGDGFAVLNSRGNSLLNNVSNLNSRYGYSYLNSPEIANDFSGNLASDNGLGSLQIANGWINGLANKAVESINRFNLSQATQITLTRTDSLGGNYRFSLTNGVEEIVFLESAQGSSANVLNTAQVYADNPADNWLRSEGQAFGSNAVVSVGAGAWSPLATAQGSNVPLSIQSTVIEGNVITATFAGGVQASFGLPGTGTNNNFAQALTPLTVRRLAWNENALALYQTDDLTGAVNGLEPGEFGYLDAALARSQSAGLFLSTAALPAYQGSGSFSLNLDATRNYGILLLPQGDLSAAYSSYSAANPSGLAQFQNLGSLDGRLTIGIEDIALASGLSDRDYNDLILTLPADNISVS